MLLLVLIILLLCGGFGTYSNWGAPLGHGIGIGTILVIVLIFMLLAGRL